MRSDRLTVDRMRVAALEPIPNGNLTGIRGRVRRTTDEVLLKTLLDRQTPVHTFRIPQRVFDGMSMPEAITEFFSTQNRRSPARSRGDQ